MKQFIFGFFLGLTFLWLSPAEAQQTGPIYCGNAGTAAAGFTTITTAVAAPATGSAKIYVCGWVASAVAASVVTFQSSTNACVSGAAIGPTIQLGTTSTAVDGSPEFRGFVVPAGSALCVTATAAANITVYYEMF